MSCTMNCNCPLPPQLLPPPTEVLLSRNETWAKNVLGHDENFFQTLANGQQPKVLWIGCVDSRVPESVITTCRPGDIFVHRNIANLFSADDNSAESALAFAVDSLHIDQIIVCGHTACGGVVTAVRKVHPKQRLSKIFEDETIKCSTNNETPLMRWLRPIVDLVRQSERDPTSEDFIPNLIEDNVRRQVKNISDSDVFKKAHGCRTERKIDIHGWIFDLENGRLRDLNETKSVSITAATSLPPSCE